MTNYFIFSPIAPPPPTVAPPTISGIPTGAPAPHRQSPKPALTATPPAMHADREPTWTLEPRSSTESRRVAMSLKVATVIHLQANEADRFDLKFGSRLK